MSILNQIRVNGQTYDIADGANIAEVFSTSKAYTAGEYCINLDTGILYKFIADKAAGVWDSSKVEQVKVTGEVTDLKSEFNSLVNLEPIETRDYFPLQMGSCWQSGVSINDMVSSTKLATIPHLIDTSLVFKIYWDDSVYELGLVPLNDNGTGKGVFYFNETSPYTTVATQSALYRTFMIKRKDDADIGDVDLNRIVYVKNSEINPIVEQSELAEQNAKGYTDSEIDKIISFKPIETRNYFPLQMGACFGSGVSINNMTSSTVIATIPQLIDTSLVFKIYWDDSVYKLGLVPLNDNGTGRGDFYFYETSPYTTIAAQSSLYRTFMIKRKDDADIGDVDLNRIVYVKNSEINPLLAHIIDLEPNGFVKYTFPSGFSWTDNPVADKVTTDGKGRFKVDYNVMDNLSTTGLDVYVATNGNDTNDGLTVETPKLTLNAAIGITNARRVHIAGGFYSRVNITELSKDIDLIGDPNDRPMFTGQSSDVVWTATGTTGVYTTTHKSYGKLFDLTTISDGMYRRYTEANSVSDVQSTQGTYYDDGTTLTMHTFRNIIPAVDNTCYTQGWPAMYIELNGHTVLAANLCFRCSGTFSSRGQLMFVGDSNNRGSFYLYNCDSSYSIRPDSENISGGSCFNPQNADGVIQHCTSYYSGNDGFSYGAGCKVVEIGCASAFNGTELITSCNGSTAHGGSYIRIGGAYHDTHGPVVHDVGTTESVNLGLAAWHSTCEGKPNFCASGGTVEMWLDSCVSYSSDRGIDVGKPDESAPNAVIYKRNCTSDVADGEYGGHIYRY